ncbi:uncharacterized protein EKO05_0010521 [Ascochyta rabiei]|uniref:uncharacterized protein n=1 Tax=Didymella rabiei TaxID=5454 RepID=UPI0019005543|nr:uncharacterized protein EKO05_0010521 [Ascochyta rabiei]UPX20284.1 hypothetical protein EKO05_0010521 [Ascochyta rabiei]
MLAELVEEKKQQYLLPGQIVVYTNSRKKAQGYAAMLGAVCYHREVGTPEEKLEILRQLTEGTEHVFVATNALGLGIDRETVRAVLFAGSRNTQKMRDVVQMGGRAGRGRLPSEVIFIRGATYSPQGKQYASGWAKDTEEGVRELVKGDGCMRVIIDREMDRNHTREGCEPGEEPCGWCQLRVHSAGAEVEAAVGDEDETERAEFNAQLQARRNLSQQERELASREQQEVQRLEEMLESWKACCQWCRAKEHADAGQHRLAHCNRLQADKVRDGVKDVTKIVREQAIWENFSCCFQCGVPQSICDSFEPHPDGGWQKNLAIGCQFEAVLLTLMMCVWTAWGSTFNDWVRAQMRREGIRRNEEVEFDKVLAWIGSTVW